MFVSVDHILFMLFMLINSFCLGKPWQIINRNGLVCYGKGFAIFGVVFSYPTYQYIKWLRQLVFLKGSTTIPTSKEVSSWLADFDSSGPIVFFVGGRVQLHLHFGSAVPVLIVIGTPYPNKQGGVVHHGYYMLLPIKVAWILHPSSFGVCFTHVAVVAWPWVSCAGAEVQSLWALLCLPWHLVKPSLNHKSWWGQGAF